jgi:hypothetical protein
MSKKLNEIYNIYWRNIIKEWRPQNIHLGTIDSVAFLLESTNLLRNQKLLNIVSTEIYTLYTDDVGMLLRTCK